MIDEKEMENDSKALLQNVIDLLEGFSLKYPNFLAKISHKDGGIIISDTISEVPVVFHKIEIVLK